MRGEGPYITILAKKCTVVDFFSTEMKNSRLRKIVSKEEEVELKVERKMRRRGGEKSVLFYSKLHFRFEDKVYIYMSD